MTLILSAGIALSMIYSSMIVICQSIDSNQSLMIDEFDLKSRIHDLGVCNYELCDSIVTKCTKTDRCSCNFKADATCAKDCVDCLEEKFGSCCACISGLCPIEYDENYLYGSHVGHTSASDQDFFNVLTEADDLHGRWKVEMVSNGYVVSHPEHGQMDLAFRKHHEESEIILSDDETFEKMNCTVAFINRNLTIDKCKLSCTSMGASYFRWFHEGCCECVGKHCFTYGVAKAKCSLQYPGTSDAEDRKEL